MNKITFWRTSDPYGCFSNFSAHPIVLDGRTFTTTEHYYQAMKFIDFDIQEKIRKESSPRSAKNLACASYGLRDDWENVKFEVMLTALRAKVSQYKDIKEKLLLTGDLLIEESSPYDYVWGTGRDGSGLNLLGKAWMQIRSEIQNGTRTDFKSI